jgi:hypothetical protein
LKEEAQDRTLWKTQFGRSYGPVARQTTTWLDKRRCNPSIRIDIFLPNPSQLITNHPSVRRCVVHRQETTDKEKNCDPEMKVWPTDSWVGRFLKSLFSEDK